MTRRIPAAQLRERMLSGAEYALLDVRETGAFSKAHLFFACNLPLSRLELIAPTRLPRKSVPIVLLGADADDEPLVMQAAQKLAAAGYSDISQLEGGTAAWAAAGGEIFSGVNVPSKAFGEFIEHWHDTPRLPAPELAALQQAGKPVVILDSRPFDEFEKMSIPGGIDCPGAELVYRVREAVSDPQTTIIVNCAGRTRSIIGAQSLINAGVPNPVYALKDGTMGWKLAGYSLAHGESAQAAEPSKQALSWAKAQTEAIATRIGLASVQPDQVNQWQADQSVSTYLLDVRTREEYLAGHWPGAIHAPGGQLVQATDEYVMVRQARLVICDSADGVRGTMTAHWLWQLGWPSLHLLIAPAPVFESPEAAGNQQLPAGVNAISAERLQTLIGNNSTPRVSVLDFSSSRAYRSGHLPGALWAIRSRLEACIAAASQAAHPLEQLVVMADSPDLAALAASDVKRLLPQADVSVLTCSLQDWRAQGQAVEVDPAVWLSEPDDIWPRPYEGKTDPRVAMQQYLDWEVGLVEQVEREGLARFRRLS